jgi:hypothetical protein
MLLGYFLVGCSSVVATSQVGSERRAFVNISRKQQNSNRYYAERESWEDEMVFVTHGNNYGKTDQKRHKATKKGLITHVKKVSKGKDYGYKHHKGSDHVLVTHGANKQTTTGAGTHGKGGSEGGKGKGGSKQGKGKGEGSKVVKRKSKITKSKGKGTDTKSKGKGMP